VQGNRKEAKFMLKEAKNEALSPPNQGETEESYVTNNNNYCITGRKEEKKEEKKKKLSNFPRKVKFGVFIDEDLLDKVREYAAYLAEYEGGYRRGILSEIVEDALRQYFGTSQTVAAHTQKHTNSPKRIMERAASNVTNKDGFYPSRILDVYLSVLREVELERQVPIEQNNCVPAMLVCKAIGAVRGPDKRTVQKWFHVFEQYGLIYTCPTDPAAYVRLSPVKR
jgi:hypothetical protein